MDRFQVEKMKCMVCEEEQPIAQDCRKCSSRMGRYYCHKCRLIDDGPGKAIFHCDKCGICLSGDKSRFYHCDACDACVALSARTKHLCKEKQLHCDCPICGDQIFASTEAIVQTECGHLMHEACLERHVEHSFKCPICLASICETFAFFRAVEKYMSTSSMPIEYRDVKSNIHCNDCRKRSVAKYHFLYHKCQLCLSYNTTMLATFTESPAYAVGQGTG
ncbi:RING finger and CHY zinc finger domain-containing protein 1 [Coemansia sp. RSA 2598]|nr:RING finger and CHY zinc finger domain-containing protein 1 [Coemansia sp. RSA 2598]